MNVYFNELTLDSTPESNLLWLKEFSRLWKTFNASVNKEAPRVLADSSTLQRLSECVARAQDPTLSTFFYAVLNKVYNPSDQEWDAQARDCFWGAEFSMQVDSRRVPCPTLGWAYVNDAMTLGFASSREWIQSPLHQINEVSAEGTERVVADVPCVTEEMHLENKWIRTWIGIHAGGAVSEVAFPDECSIDPTHKKIHYRKDHGKEILDAFARRLVQNKYVVEVVNSTEWDRGCDHFIKDVRCDGIVYVCLHWHDEGYGLAVKTTAIGVPQTRKVAELLEQQFDQRT